MLEGSENNFVKIIPAIAPSTSPIVSFCVGRRRAIINMMAYDTIGLSTVTSTPPAPAFPVTSPLKNKNVYKEIMMAAMVRSNIPLR